MKDTANLWKNIQAADVSEIPKEAMRELIDICSQEKTAEEELCRALKRALKEAQENDENVELWWLMIIAGGAKSQAAIPSLLQCFEIPDEDISFEIASWSLVQIGEPAMHAIMDWISGEPDCGARLSGYAILENALDVSSPETILKVKTFLKKRVVKEEAKTETNSALDFALQTLAHFPGEDVLPFVRQVVGRYEYDPELAEVFATAEGRSDFTRDPLSLRTWQETAQKYASMVKSFEDYEARMKRHQKILAEGKRLFSKKDWKKLELIFPKMEEASVNRWTVYEIKALMYVELDRLEPALEALSKAIEDFEREWKIFPSIVKYEDMERLQALRDILNQVPPAQGMGKRCLDYLEGILIPLGAVKLKDAHHFLVKHSQWCKDLNLNEWQSLLRVDPRFILDGDWIISSKVRSPQKLVEAQIRRGLDPRFSSSLSEIKLFQEGRCEWFYEKWEKQADQDLRIITLGVWNLEKLRQEIRQDFEGSESFLRLAADWEKYGGSREELMEVLSEVWHHTPRWELCGRTPDEVRRTQPAPQAIASVERKTSAIVQDNPGRNDPCPCGSGKKYKKCCLDKFHPHFPAPISLN